MRTELVITCVTSCVSFVWIVFLVKKRLDRFKQFGSFFKMIEIVLKMIGIVLKTMWIV